MLAKRHYERLAEVLRSCDAQLAYSIPMPTKMHDDVMELFCAQIAMMCAKDNPSFDSFRFYEATGIARFREERITATVKNPPPNKRGA